MTTAASNSVRLAFVTLDADATLRDLQRAATHADRGRPRSTTDGARRWTVGGAKSGGSNTYPAFLVERYLKA